MNSQLLSEFGRRYPVLKLDFQNPILWNSTMLVDRELSAEGEHAITRTRHSTPNPQTLLVLVPDSLAHVLLNNGLSVKAGVSSIEGRCSSTRGKVVTVGTVGFHDLLHEFGHFLWQNVFDQKTKLDYARIVGASNHMAIVRGNGLVRHNSTEEHFARNVQNVVMLRALEFFEHEPGAADELLSFLEKTGVIDHQRKSVFHAVRKENKFFLANNAEDISRADAGNGVYFPEAERVLNIMMRARERR
ncbi:TPA: hypothetical protein HA244_02410 [Candidatus Micrarchaeota archaeon]|nr:hypothetical protein [Candidatus Micrarchaeota archaeon]